MIFQFPSSISRITLLWLTLGRKRLLDRRSDVYKLEAEELGDDLDTLPFISHHTLNISRDVISELLHPPPGTPQIISSPGPALSVSLCLHIAQLGTMDGSPFTVK